jgi:hypothetical protein
MIKFGVLFGFLSDVLPQTTHKIFKEKKKRSRQVEVSTSFLEKKYYPDGWVF